MVFLIALLIVCGISDGFKKYPPALNFNKLVVIGAPSGPVPKLILTPSPSPQSSLLLPGGLYKLV